MFNCREKYDQYSEDHIAGCSCVSNKNALIMLCVVWYHLHNLKNMKNSHGGVLLLVQLQASVSNFTKSNTPPWLFFTFFKLYKSYQLAQRTTFIPPDYKWSASASMIKPLLSNLGINMLNSYCLQSQLPKFLPKNHK